MLKKIIMILGLLLVSSCQMFLVDSSEWVTDSPKRGNPDYKSEIFSMEDILKRPRVVKRLEKNTVSLPEKTTFKYGSVAMGTDKIFGKKRKYFYDEVSKLGSEIYLVEDTKEEIEEIIQNLT